MKIDISFQKTFGFRLNELYQWAFKFKKYKVVKGFILRVFGIYLNVRENDATYKIIEYAKKQRLNKSIKQL